MTIDPYDYQRVAVSQLKTGSILCGGVGSGKSITSLMYYMYNEYPKKDLYIITTAAKRDSGEWEEDCDSLSLEPKKVDSWNNIAKYVKVTDAFFIFDEQRVVGSGTWVKSFLKITKANAWILLSATPGDTWMDYIPVFVANGFYKNRTEFIRRHVVWNNFIKFPKVDHYVETARLVRLRSSILVTMQYRKPTTSHVVDMVLDYDPVLYDIAVKRRWNPYTNLPIKDVSQLFVIVRKIVNSDPSRLSRVETLIDKHKRVIVFYNFNYELEILRRLNIYQDLVVTEYNGQKHDSISDALSWAHLVQYKAGAEGWNCIETNTVIFYSLNYSHKTMIQAGGRIDRLNTKFEDLYYYRLMSQAPIDMAILKALKEKRNFNESTFVFK